MSHVRISDMAETNKPYEKAVQYGIRSLSDAELLAVILRTGTKDVNVIHLAEQILSSHPVHKGLVGLNYLSMEELTEIPGIGNVKAVQIRAVTELSRRISREKTREQVRLNQPETIADYFREEVRYLEKERVYALFFNSACYLIRDVLISEGTVNRSLVSPREVFQEALRCGAVNLILLHNHPSGDCEPSAADLELTRRFKSAGAILGITLLDHIIIGGSSYVSFSERGLLDEV
ncbi:MAG: DNA repair protein RadC [Eubacterium sp.]|nr:DNA repair protein RadC [Eubacterium sp.]